MSTAAADDAATRRAARVSGTAFVLLLVLAVLWPAPVLQLNDWTVRQSLSIHEDSFLGREAPSWDVVFWGIAGLFLLVLLHSRIRFLDTGVRMFIRDIRRLWRALPRVASHMHPRKAIVFIVAGVVGTAVLWLFLDVPLIALVESLQGDHTRAVTRLLNRLGGGFNPPLIVAYFAVAGLIYLRPRWTELSMCMLLAGGAAGVIVQALKYLFGRSRPELWLGAFHHTWPSATSFPSGHTVGGFAIASVIAFGARAPMLRVAAMALAIGIGFSRIFAFRHWPSDVFASAVLGTWVGWIFTEALLGAEEEAQHENGADR
jgi:hypothetical protein